MRDGECGNSLVNELWRPMTLFNYRGVIKFVSIATVNKVETRAGRDEKAAGITSAVVKFLTRCSKSRRTVSCLLLSLDWKRKTARKVGVENTKFY